jgi:hypothetical protein
MNMSDIRATYEIELQQPDPEVALWFWSVYATDWPQGRRRCLRDGDDGYDTAAAAAEAAMACVRDAHGKDARPYIWRPAMEAREAGRLSGGPSLMAQAQAWPYGCHDLSSCMRNGACMYMGCVHGHRPKEVQAELRAAVAAAKLRAEGGE